MAEELADRGIAAAVVRYYDGLPARTKRKQSPRIFTQRERILDHVIGNLIRREQVKGDVIGVFGYSLGGFHTMALAAKDERVAAGVSLAGGLSGHIPHTEVQDAAPLLLIHGTRDRVVPFRRSVIARAAWRKSGQSAYLMPLNGVGHVPYGKTREHAFVAAADFIEENLMAAILPPIPRARPVIPVPRTPPPARELAKAR
jgi:dienelactone hydrolase